MNLSKPIDSKEFNHASSRAVSVRLERVTFDTILVFAFPFFLWFSWLSMKHGWLGNIEFIWVHFSSGLLSGAAFTSLHTASRLGYAMKFDDHSFHYYPVRKLPWSSVIAIETKKEGGSQDDEDAGLFIELHLKPLIFSKIYPRFWNRWALLLDIKFDTQKCALLLPVSNLQMKSNTLFELIKDRHRASQAPTSTNLKVGT